MGKYDKNISWKIAAVYNSYGAALIAKNSLPHVKHTKIGRYGDCGSKYALKIGTLVKDRS